MTTIKIVKTAGILVFSICIWTSCVYDTFNPQVPDEVSFSEDIIPIFNSSCNRSGCHNERDTPPNLSPEVAWSSLLSGGYINTSEPENSLLYVKILPPDGSMARYATDRDRMLILSWLQQGARDN